MKVYSKDYFLQKILECNEETLQNAKLQKEKVCKEYKIAKKKGYREIVAVQTKSELAKLQGNLLKNFFSKIPVSVSTKGFVKGCSYVNFLEEHMGQKFFLRLDIEDFFGSITKRMLCENLEPFADPESIDEIVELCTWKEKIPQGYITSPAISNLVFRRIDQRIRKYCRSYHREMKRNIVYTRYADDMLFSSVGFDFKSNKNFKRMISHILQENGFRCNESKTIYTQGEISLSGYVIENDVRLSRKKLYNINEVIYQFDGRDEHDEKTFRVKRNVDIEEIRKKLNDRKLKKSNGEILSFPDVSSLVHYIAGYRSYLIQIARVEHGNTGRDKKIRKKIERLETILEFLSEALEKKQVH